MVDMCTQRSQKRLRQLAGWAKGNASPAPSFGKATVSHWVGGDSQSGVWDKGKDKQIVKKTNKQKQWGIYSDEICPDSGKEHEIFMFATGELLQS